MITLSEMIKMMIGDGGDDADVSVQVEAQEGKVILPGNAAKLTS